MVKMVKEVRVSASPEFIWSIIVKHLKHPEIEGDRNLEWKRLAIKNIRGESLTSKREGVGVKTRWYYTFYGFPYNWDDEVIEWEEFKRITWKSISTWEMVDSFIIIPVNSESKLIYEMEYTPPWGLFGKFHFSLFVNKHLEKHLEYTLRQMKRSAERLSQLHLKKRNS